jgi:hypothetical protein
MPSDSALPPEIDDLYRHCLKLRRQVAAPAGRRRPEAPRPAMNII